jgi:FkbM family methyltransferase
MLKRGVQAVLRTFGYQLNRVSSSQIPFCGLANFFPLIKRFGFDPKHILDIGANHGKWTREALHYFPNAHYTLVEPQAELRASVQDLFDRGVRVKWIHCGVSDHSGVLPLHVIGLDHSSTFRQEQSVKNGAIRSINVPMQTVNQIVAATGLPIPEMVKIDAEGFDLKVLAGASELLGRAEIFLAEAEVCEPEFENTMLALIQKMNDSGYRLIDITDMNRSPEFGVVWLCELVFLSKRSKLLDTANRY